MTSPLEMHGPLPSGREGWEWALERLITPAVERAALGPRRQPAIASSSDAGATWWELVTRPLWGLASVNKPDLWTVVRETIAKAVDPRHEWYIGPPGARNQRLVESAAVGHALMLAPQHLWDPLTGEQRDNLGGWLRTASEAEPVDNNWHFFPVLAGRGLDAVGFARHDRDAEHLARLDSFYVSQGWYRDGDTGRFDYYNPFGFHFYNLLLRRGFEHAAEFARGFDCWFAATGEAVPFGRSLGYRLAQGAFWGALAHADLQALPWGRIRGLAQRHLEWWWRRPILDGGGLLSIGYGYPNTGVVEQYMGGGSPYWGSKFFLPLALPDRHPFWTIEPEPVSDGTATNPVAVVQRHNGHVTLLNGQGWAEWARGGEAKYAKFAYSTRAGFSVAAGDRGLAHGAYDSMLALSDDGGTRWRAREEVEQTSIDGGILRARWRPWPDVEVETWLVPRGDWHLRVHRLSTPRTLHSAEGGFCQPWRTPGPELPEASAAAGRASFANSAIHDLDGNREGELVRPLAGANVLHGRTVLPTLRGVHGPGEHVLTCAVYLGDDPGDEVAWSGAVAGLGIPGRRRW